VTTRVICDEKLTYVSDLQACLVNTYKVFENINLPRLMGEVRLQKRITARSLFRSEDVGDAEKRVLPCQWDNYKCQC
jgi:hypothetical protein